MAEEDYTEILDEWYNIAGNANQYEFEKKLNNILKAIMALMIQKKKDIIKIIDDNYGDVQRQIDISQEEDDVGKKKRDTNVPYWAKNYEAILVNLKIIKELKKEIADINSTLNKSLAEQIEFISEYSYGLNYAMLYYAGLALDLPGLTSREIKSILDFPFQGKRRNERIDAETTKLEDKIIQAIMTAMILGKSKKELIAEIELLFPNETKNGALYNYMSLLERTEVQAAIVMASSYFFWQNRSLFEGVTYSAVWDNRICSICAGYAAQYEGSVYPIDRVPVLLPVHGGCRCLWIPTSITFSRIMDVYNLQEALSPRKLRFRKSSDIKKAVRNIRGRYRRWKSVKLKNGETIKIYPKNYLEKWLNEKKDGRYAISNEWVNNFRKKYEKASSAFINV